MKKRRRRRRRSKKGTVLTTTPKKRRLRWRKKENCKLAWELIELARSLASSSKPRVWHRIAIRGKTYSPVNDEYFWINNPANRTHQKKANNPPSLSSLPPSIHPSIQHCHRKWKQDPPTKKKTKINDRQESCDETKFHPILFYSTTNEKRTIDPSPWISRRRRKFVNKKSIEKKTIFCEFDLFICCTYLTYILGTSYLLYIYEVILSIISLKKEKTLSSVLFFLPNENSDRRGKER